MTTNQHLVDGEAYVTYRVHFLAHPTQHGRHEHEQDANCMQIPQFSPTCLHSQRSPFNETLCLWIHSLSAMILGEANRQQSLHRDIICIQLCLQKISPYSTRTAAGHEKKKVRLHAGKILLPVVGNENQNFGVCKHQTFNGVPIPICQEHLQMNSSISFMRFPKLCHNNPSVHKKLLCVETFTKTTRISAILSVPS